ncbi:MAG: prephenate dehydratase [Verrucomicrobiales bacterium]|nr:prephenate dehydratase [Verrucomicrobiales bacterium]HQW28210.1 prephenate dehydratase [Verrucomicrobiales bacterium]
MSLEEQRIKIDAIDTDIIRLLNERADIVHEIGVIKKREGLEIYAPEREEKLLRSLVVKGEGGRLPEESIRAIYREIMSAALALEEDLKIAYLGPAGTWTHQAAIGKFGHSVKYLPQPSFGDVFDQVERRIADYGVVPIENSTEGAVTHTLDLFADSPLKIYGQVMMPIENNLMANCPREEIRHIYSHPQIIAQCRGWLSRNFREIQPVEKSSSAAAAEFAAKEPGSAVLGGALLAELYGLLTLETSIQDIANNTTRFLVISQKTCPPTGKDRTSVMFSVRDEPGSLHRALEPFEKLAINMSKIESRPSKRRAWEYYFFVDIAGHCEDPELADVIKQLEKHCSFVKVLGSYPA